jgi:hypothetical protein
MIFLQICTLSALLWKNFLIIAHNLLGRGSWMLLASSTVLCLPVYVVTASATYIVLFVRGVVAIGTRLNLFRLSSKIACPRTSNALRFPVQRTPISICVLFCARVAAFRAKRFLGRAIPVVHVILLILLLMFSVVLLCLVAIFLRSCSSLNLCLCLFLVASKRMVLVLSVRFMGLLRRGRATYFHLYILFCFQ